MQVLLWFLAFALKIYHECIWWFLDLWAIFILLGLTLSFSTGIKHRVRACVVTVYKREDSSVKTWVKLWNEWRTIKGGWLKEFTQTSADKWQIPADRWKNSREAYLGVELLGWGAGVTKSHTFTPSIHWAVIMFSDQQSFTP